MASRLQKKGESKAEQRVIERDLEWEHLPTRPAVRARWQRGGQEVFQEGDMG